VYEFQVQLVATHLNDLYGAVHKMLPSLINSEETFLKFPELTPSIWYFKFIQLLLKISEENDDREPLVQYLQTHPHYIESELLENVIAFVREWTPGTSVNWYTKDRFVHRMLNKAFRLRDFGFLILFRFFIADMHKQIYEKSREQTIKRENICYRGQLIYKNEIESFEEKQLISSLGFFSTSETKNYHTVMEFYAGAKNHPLTDDIQSVLFKITLSSSKYQQLTFSAISGLSHFGDAENEVLFTVGSYFEISQILYDNEYSCWIVEATEGYILDKMNVWKRPFEVEMVALGFYLFIRNDNFKLAEDYYKTLLSISNSLTWIIACYVGFGLIEYFRKNYQLALEKFQQALEIIREENLDKTCRIIGNIHCLIGNVHCLIGNVHREMKCFDQAFKSYELAIQIYPIRFYFIEQNDQYWLMHNYTEEFNSFVGCDKYFYYCDRPLLNKIITYKITVQWRLAIDTLKHVLNDTKEIIKTGDVEMFVKVLEFCKENENTSSMIVTNRKILGDQTYSNFMNTNDKSRILHAYIELGSHCIDHNRPDDALIYYQEVHKSEVQMESFMNVECFYDIGRVYELKEDYNKAIEWFRKAIDYTITNITSTDYSTNIFQYIIYENFLVISNEKINDKRSSIIYMREIISQLIKTTNYSNEIDHLIAKIYKITIQYYTINDKTKIELICNDIIEMLDKINLNNRNWKKWLCLGSTCSLKIFDTNHDSCQPLLDDNYHLYLKLYEKIFDVISQKESA
jgi:tetratricopeptide (TPR) repeat protein